MVNDSFCNIPLIIYLLLLLFLFVVDAALHLLYRFTISRPENVIKFEKEKVRMSEHEAVAVWLKQAITGGRL